ncbi:hypothetical protein Tco_0547014, partial [Tanacetum coccineum]
SGSGTVVAARATVVIGGVMIGVVICCNIGVRLVTNGGGGRVVAGVIIGI